MIRRVIAVATIVAGIVLGGAAAPGADPAEIRIGYLRQPEPKLALSLLQGPADNDGVAGAQLAIDDNKTTGAFLRQRLALEEMRRKPGDAPAAAASALADRGGSLIIAALAPDALLKAADAGRSRGVMVFNAGASDDRLREEDCRANVIHTAPTRSMLADGLAQYLAWKQWRRWL